MQKKWLVKQTDNTIVQELQEVLRIHPALCTSLVIEEFKLLMRPVSSFGHQKIIS